MNRLESFNQPSITTRNTSEIHKQPTGNRTKIIKEGILRLVNEDKKRQQVVFDIVNQDSFLKDVFSRPKYFTPTELSDDNNSFAFKINKPDQNK